MRPPIPDAYWVQPGRLLAGEYPGAREEAAALQKLRHLLHVGGITFFLDLTEEGEHRLQPYAPYLARLASTENLPLAEHRRMPIRDLGVPAPETMWAILDLLKAALAEGRGVYVHCWGGIGRTGTVVGCYLVSQGLTGEQALAQIAAWRRDTPDGDRPSPETDEQRRLVLSWHGRTLQRP